MAEQKRRWGDRRDATLLRDVDSLHFIMGIIYPNRADNEAYIAERVNLEPIKDYIATKNYEGIPFKYTFFHVILTALVKTVILRPKLNRFYANENYYQRNKVTAGFVIKKEFADGSEEAMALLEIKPESTIDTIHEEIHQEVAACREQKKVNTTDNSMNVLNSLPRFLSKAAVRFIRWGTCSFFCVIGEKKWTPLYDEHGLVEMQETVDLGLTVDERIADGYYYAKSVRLFKYLLEHPTLLERPLSEEVDYE